MRGNTAVEAFPAKPRCSVTQFDRKLNLARRPGSLTDNSESAAPHYIGWQAEIHEVEHIEELGAKLDCAEFGIASAPERRVFHQGDVEILETRSAECVPAQGSEAPMIRARPSGNVYR